MTANPAQRPALPWRLWIGSAVVLTMLALCASSASRAACYANSPPREQVAQGRATMLATEAFAEWAQAHPEATCPASIDELTRSDAHDPWGRSYRVICTKTRVAVVSAGPDATFGTSDDISNLREPE